MAVGVRGGECGLAACQAEVEGVEEAFTEAVLVSADGVDRETLGLEEGGQRWAREMAATRRDWVHAMEWAVVG